MLLIQDLKFYDLWTVISHMPKGPVLCFTIEWYHLLVSKHDQAYVQ